MKTIILIPPNGILKKQDFVLERLSHFFKKNLHFQTILICISEEESTQNKIFDKIIYVKNKNDILEELESINYDLIITRGWMHAYNFSALITKKFKNVIALIKDWNFSSPEEYKFLFKDNSDFQAIDYIFKNAKYILSHYTHKQSEIWAKEYNVEQSKFIFFPEYCIEENFNKKSFTYKKSDINLVFAGTLPPSSYPEGFFLTKGLLRASKLLSKHNITINIMLPPRNYNDMFNQKLLYQDLIFENEFNSKFKIHEGKVLNPTVLDKFDFGFFILEYTVKNEYLNKYAVPSKFAFYLESGIPIIINKKHKALASYVKKYNLGIVFSNKDIGVLHKKLNSIRKNDYKVFLKNIIKFRETFTYKDSTFTKILSNINRNKDNYEI